MPVSAELLDSELKKVVAALHTALDVTGQTVSYTVIPGKEGPRWLVPNEGQFAHKILSQWQPYNPGARAYWKLLCLLSRVSALRFLPRTRQAELPANTGTQLLHHIGANIDVGPPVVFIGSPSATHKLLLFLTSRNQDLAAVVKLALTDLARETIRSEADVLRKLNGRFGAPRLLHYSEETGSAMQEYLSGRMGTRRFQPEYLALLLKLAETEKTISLRVRGEFLANRLRQCPEYQAQSQLVEDALEYLGEEISVPAVLVHNDFAPWNLRHLDDGRTVLIDWEIAEWDALPLHDLCYFFYIQTRLFEPAKCFYTTMLRQGSWQSYCQKLGISPALAPKLSAAFLLTMLARVWETKRDVEADSCITQIQRFLTHSRTAAH